MTKIFTAIFAAALAVLLITGTAYADQGTGNPAQANLNFTVVQGSQARLRIGSPYVIDNLTWNLGIPSGNTLLPDSASTLVPIELELVMDATEQCDLSVTGNDLISWGNAIPIDRFHITATTGGDFSFNTDMPSAGVSIVIDTFSTAGLKSGTFSAFYDDSYSNVTGTYTSGSNNSAVFTATIY